MFFKNTPRPNLLFIKKDKISPSRDGRFGCHSVGFSFSMSYFSFTASLPPPTWRVSALGSINDLLFLSPACAASNSTPFFNSALQKQKKKEKKTYDTNYVEQNCCNRERKKQKWLEMDCMGRARQTYLPKPIFCDIFFSLFALSNRMSFRELRMLTENLRLLGYPKVVSMESFREANFKLVAGN